MLNIRKHVALLATAATLTGGLALAGPALAAPAPAANTPAASAGTVHADSYRDVSLSIGGGKMTATISWSGPSGGPYHGKVSGATLDTRSDGHCIEANALEDGQPLRIPSSYTCRANDHGAWKYWHFNYSNTYSVKVRVCKTDNGRSFFGCTRWS
jgi:hypothetical protein